MTIPWDDARIFLAVAETGSLSAAARRLRLTQPTVSRRLAELERVLGEPLFDRNVAGATLTAHGERLVEPARRMADWAAEFASTAEQTQVAAGVVRITAAPGIAHALLVPFAAAMASRLPNIEMHVVSTVRPLDLTRREADVALRLGSSGGETLVASATLELRAFAAERYAEKVRGRTDPADVDWIGWTSPFDDLSPNTTLRRLVPGWRPAFASDDYLLQIRACEMALGAMLLAQAHPRFGVQARLVELPLHLPVVRRTLSLHCPKSALAIPRVRAVVEPLVEVLRQWGTAG